MLRGTKIVRTILNAAIFVFLEVAALNMLSSSQSAHNFFLAKYSHAFMGKVWGMTQGVRYYASLRKVNDALSEENFYLRLRLLSRGDEAAATGSGEDLLTSTEIGSFRYCPATIVKVGRTGQRNYVIIGSGSEDGVLPQSGIITPNGVVGIVDAVGKRYSYAISFMNAEVNVSARLGREGAVGPMVWDGKRTHGALLKEIPLQFKFQPGDTVFTSGHSSIFPSDIPLGIAGTSRIVNGATYEITVDLFQDMAALRYVTLVTNMGQREIEDLERQEEEGMKEKKK